MNLLADESVDRLIVTRLRENGHAVEAVGETNPSISDDEVLRRAFDSGRVLLTADKDFGELVFRLGRAHAGVVLLRLAGCSSADRAEIVLAVIREHETELSGKFTVVTPDAVRIRRSERNGDG